MKKLYIGLLITILCNFDSCYASDEHNNRNTNHITALFQTLDKVTGPAAAGSALMFCGLATILTSQNNPHPDNKWYAGIAEIALGTICLRHSMHTIMNASHEHGLLFAAAHNRVMQSYGSLNPRGDENV